MVGVITGVQEGVGEGSGGREKKHFEEVDGAYWFRAVCPCMHASVCTFVKNCAY